MTKVAVLWNGRIETLAYNDDWLDAFKQSKLCQVTDYDSRFLGAYKAQKILYRYEYIILLHSTNSNGFQLPKLYRYGGLKLRRAKIVMFVGNEYKLMPEKIKFLKQNNIEYVVSQLPKASADWLYDGTGSKVIALPHALNAEIFKSTTLPSNRNIHIGSRVHKYPYYLGDNNRNMISQVIDDLNSEFIVDFSSNPKDRFTRKGWAEFLSNCRATVSSEAGAKFLERDDKLRILVNNYLKEKPDATYADVHRLFFEGYSGDHISGKTIAARHLEAVGTKTCQILLEGNYNGVLEPDAHYLSLNSDLSNLTKIKEQLRDSTLLERIADQALDHILSQHTHKHRINELFDQI